MWKCHYEQATGLFTICSPLPFRVIGYAGRREGRNNPDLQMIRSMGPLPQGSYRIGLPFTHPEKGPLCFRLTPDTRNEMYGRAGFLIHGDNTKGDASEGCIILNRPAREVLARAVNQRKTALLEVFALLPCSKV